jgi:hypothetical protein
MANKRGFELSLNMIIIVILALVFLGLAIAFIVKLIPDVPIVPSQCKISPPTAESPVCINSDYEIARGKGVQLKTSFYNNEDADIPDTEVPSIACGTTTDGAELSLGVTSIGSNLAVGEHREYLIVVKVPKDATRGTYPCNVKLSETQGQFTITVK